MKMVQRSGVPKLTYISDGLVLVPLTKEQFAVIDIHDIELIQYNFWYLTADNRYAAARINGEIVLMHRLILGLDKGEVCDHIDGDGLNNRRSNLRSVSQAENMWNTDRHKFRLGISIDNTNNRWKVYIDEPGQKRANVGTVRSREEAEILLIRAKKLREAIADFEEFRNACVELKPDRSNARLNCTIEGCAALAAARGMCNKHYLRWYANKANINSSKSIGL